MEDTKSPEKSVNETATKDEATKDASQPPKLTPELVKETCNYILHLLSSAYNRDFADEQDHVYYFNTAELHLQFHDTKSSRWSRMQVRPAPEGPSEQFEKMRDMAMAMLRELTNEILDSGVYGVDRGTVTGDFEAWNEMLNYVHQATANIKNNTDTMWYLTWAGGWQNSFHSALYYNLKP